MKKIVLIFFVGIFCNAFGQEFTFPIDETGKYIFSEVVEIPGMSKEQEFENGVAFMKKIKVLNSKKKHLIKDSENFTIENKGSFLVYNINSVKTGIDGAVEYDIQLEFKDGRYRYTITNFLFNEYKRNRYAKYVPTSKFAPLEMEASSLNKRSWEKHRKVVYEKTQELIINLNGAIIYDEEKETKKIKKKDNW